MCRGAHTDCGYHGIVAANVNSRKICSSGAVDVLCWVGPGKNQLAAVLLNPKVMDGLWNSNEWRQRVANPATRGEKEEEREQVRKSETATSNHLQDVTAEILILNDFGKHFLDVSRVDTNVLLLEVRPLERNLVEKFLHDRVQAASTDVLCAFVD